MHTRSPKIVLGILAASVALGGADPFLGTWRLNPEKSKEGAPPPSPARGVMTCGRGGNVIRCTQDGVDAEGRSVHVEYTYSYDGKEHPVKGSRAVDSVSVKRIGPREQEWTVKKSGQLAGTFRLLVSKDGKTMTGTWSVKDAAGNVKSGTCTEICHR